ARTRGDVYRALDNELEIIRVINNIALPNADPDPVAKELEDVNGIYPEDVILASAKSNIGIEDILERVVDAVPPPSGEDHKPLKALIFDSLYDSYRGVITYICIKEGSVKVGDKIKLMATGKEFEVNEIGVFTLAPDPEEKLTVGDVGYLTASIKTV